MPRKRMIDPDSWTDEKLAELTIGAHLLWVGLVSQADDEGRLEWSARQLRIRLFPVKKDVTVDTLEAWMSEIESTGAVRVYTVDDRCYAYHPGWKSHQKISHVTSSKLPPPDSGYFRSIPENTGEDRKIPVDSPQYKRREEKRREVTESFQDSAENLPEKYVPPPFPSGLRASIPEDVNDLKRLAVPFLEAFCNATSPEARAKHGPAYVDALAAFRGRGCTTGDAWRAFGDARDASNGKPIFGSAAKKALNYASTRPKLAAVPTARGADWDALSDREKRLRDPGHVGTPPIEGIL